MTFTVLIVSIEQNEEFQESRVHYTLAGIKSLLKIGGGRGSPLVRKGGSGTPGTFPWLRLCRVLALFILGTETSMQK